MHPIHLGRGLLANPSVFSPYILGKQVCIITNPVIAQHYLAPLQSALSDYTCDVLVLPEGEAHKTLVTWEKILDHLLARQHKRSSTLIALGGGVIGDLTGFAAACYQRGIAFIQVPTTLLAQVDSSVGGKTAVNHAKGKNMIGAFHQPSAVIIDLDTLGTLPSREFNAGLAEVIKYGLIADADFFEWIEKNIALILQRDSDALSHVIKRSCSIKADIVASDERDQGIRAILNFGHTFGHAIETLTDYTRFLHGEAVAIGMVLACRLSARVCQLDESIEKRLLDLLVIIGLPDALPSGLTMERLIAVMKQDKKNLTEQMTFILLDRIGRASVSVVTVELLC